MVERLARARLVHYARLAELMRVDGEVVFFRQGIGSGTIEAYGGDV